jgi:hypothetical protein
MLFEKIYVNNREYHIDFNIVLASCYTISLSSPMTDDRYNM